MSNYYNYIHISSYYCLLFLNLEEHSLDDTLFSHLTYSPVAFLLLIYNKNIPMIQVLAADKYYDEIAFLIFVIHNILLKYLCGMPKDDEAFTETSVWNNFLISFDFAPHICLKNHR